MGAGLPMQPGDIAFKVRRPLRRHTEMERDREREREMRETDRHVRTEQRCAGPHAAPLGADRRVGVCTGGMHVRYS
jgi:hypothetical protein